MAQDNQGSPFHSGERAAQQRAGVGDISKWAGGFIRDYMPDQHRAFYQSLPFLVLSGADADGATWVTLIDGPEGFIRSPDATRLHLNAEIDDQDPLFPAFSAGTDIGLIGIELATRRRNRLSGHLSTVDGGYSIAIRQTFGNCPQYIHERDWQRVSDNAPKPARFGQQLTPEQIALIQNADTMFIGTGHTQGADVPSRGFDASHRGGAPGFVQVNSPGHLRIPDYSGNNFFNTIGNLMTDPAIGLVFVDFETGGLLHVSGRASVDWQPIDAKDPDAWRMIDVQIASVIERPNALALRWNEQQQVERNLIVARKQPEAHDITSFYLHSEADAPLPGFRAGQHLPVQVHIPGQPSATRRSYSLSGDPNDNRHYRLTIKHEPGGQVSGYFHRTLKAGDEIKVSRPAGEFVVPEGNDPLVLVSAGVGITPMVSMLHAIVSQPAPRPLWFLHGTQNRKTHALREEVEGLLARHPKAAGKVFYSRSEIKDAGAEDNIASGRIIAADILGLKAGSAAQYMLCGPAQFLSDISSGLEEGGVNPQNIHVEVFGNGGTQPG